MKHLLTLSFALMLCIGATAQTTVTVTGYDKDGDYELTSAMEQKLTTNAVGPIKLALSHMTDGKVIIAIDGYASRTGTHGINENMGEKRAEQVESFFKRSFPNAIFSPLTKGDRADSRMVIVSWKVIGTANPAPPAPPKNEDLRNALLIGSVPASGTIIILVAWFITSRRKPELQPIAQAEAVVPAIEAPAAPAPEIKFVDVESGGYRYTVPVTIQNGNRYLPFPTQENPNELLRRIDAKAARNCIKKCIENPFYQPTIERLIAEETIKKEKS